MVSDEKITSFLRLQQMALDIKDSTTLLNQFLPKVLEETALLGFSFIFLSAIFVDTQQKVTQSFFIDRDKYKMGDITKGENLFQKGREWEMKVMYGEAAIVSDVDYLINSQYPRFSEIKSLLIVPIQHGGDLCGALVAARSKNAEQIDREEIEYAEMVTRLIDLGFRLQDTETSLTKITKQVYEMNAKLHQLDKLKDDFVSVASHELRTPMTAIRSYVWMALHRSDIPLSQKLERYLYRTLVSTERLINLVNDMLNLSRIEAGRIEINPKPFNILELSKEVMEEVKAKADEKSLKLIVLEHKIPDVFGDPDKVHQVLLNLVGNSLKFSYPNGEIIIDFVVNTNMIEVSVKDSGAGISKDDLSKLFHKFSRLDSSYTAVSTSGGTGLGLYISKNLIDLMHGKVWATSDGSEKGSIFSFSLPIATGDLVKQTAQLAVKVEGEVKNLEPVAI